MDDHDRISVICTVCKIEFHISYGRFRRMDKSTIKCKHCLSNYRKELQRNYWKNLTPEQKTEIQKNMSNGIDNRSDDKKKLHGEKISMSKKHKYASLNAEEKAKVIQTAKNASDVAATKYHNLSDEAKFQKAANQSIISKTYHAGLSDEERQVHNKNISVGWLSRSEEQKKATSEIRIKIHEDRSTEDKNTISRKISESLKEYHNQMSIEQKEQWAQSISDGMKEYILSLTEDEKNEYIRPITDYWKNVTLNERHEIYKQRSEFMKSYWKNMSVDEFNDWSVRRAIAYNEYIDNLDKIPNRNENTFIDHLNQSQIEYKYHGYKNTTVDEAFHDMFQCNPITGSKFVNCAHSWDFIISTSKSSILIDVDGSIHDPTKAQSKVTHFNGTEFKLSDNIQWNDSKRPYQTDGLDAYVVMCYDDNLTDDTPVLSFQTGEIMNVKQLISILQLDSMTKKEIKKLLKEARPF